ncbi:MAG TPA: hypothetical protein VF530_05065 [Planctomycetota bacterium]
MRPSLAFLAACLALACHAPAPAPDEPEPVAPPAASALAGLVQALEALAAQRPAGCALAVRAVEADVLLDANAGRLCERVFLDLSVYAPTMEEARAGFDALWGALAPAAEAPAAEPVAPARVRAALRQLALPAGLDEGWLSWSERLRIELVPGGPPPPDPSASAATPAQASFEGLVRNCAARVDSVGQVDLLALRSRLGVPQVLVRPGMEFQRFTTDQIGTFLASLEEESPAVRVRRIVIERSAHEPDVASARGWTFEAELALGVP